MLIDRKGKVQLVIVGQPGSIYIPELPAMPTDSNRLRGLRLLHTHLGDSSLSQEDLMDLLFLRLDAIIALNVNEIGEPILWQGAWLVKSDPNNNKSEPYFVDKQKSWHLCECDFTSIITQFEKVSTQKSRLHNAAQTTNRALLISVSSDPIAVQEANLDELNDLATSAGAYVCGRMIQRIRRSESNSIPGKGKLAELEIMALDNNADILIFDGELTPSQLHDLADLTERKTLDRTQLILDIFARRAKSKTGCLQVELAQLAYLLPRLSKSNRAFDRLMGGIGGRGPGESKLETDRRRIRERISSLKLELKNLRRQRDFISKRRQRSGIPLVAMVGYTNAGKSTLLNVMTNASVFTADKLFATLDPVVRRVRFPHEREITFADTVGFIRNLPKELWEAFRATLEELEKADLLLHIANVRHPEFTNQIEAVENVLEEMNLNDIPRLLVLNKCDGLSNAAMQNLKENFPDAILISAIEKWNLDILLTRIENLVFSM